MRTHNARREPTHMGLQPTVRMRIVFAKGRAIGPGKIDLLAAIERHGSIAAAGRAMKMSYQRAWSLVEELNAMFNDPVVTVSRGGATRGGALLTDVGKTVLEQYRAVETTTADVCRAQLEALADLLRVQETDISKRR